MRSQNYTRCALVAMLLMCGNAVASAEETPAVDPAALDGAFESLNTFDWGQELSVLQPIEDAVVAYDEAQLLGLETRLAAVLGTDAPLDAKNYACRKLRIIGTAESTPALAALLPDKDLSHMARYALQRMPAPEASKALRDALPKVDGKQKMGVIGSIGAKRDAEAVPALVELLGDPDKGIASTAADALGTIGTPEAAKALLKFQKDAPEGVKESVANALLASAEKLLADGKKVDAMKVYKALTGEDQPKHVRLAATRGMLSVAGKKD